MVINGHLHRVALRIQLNILSLFVIILIMHNSHQITVGIIAPLHTGSLLIASFSHQHTAFIIIIPFPVKKIIITNDDIDYSTSTVYHYKLRDFLLMESL